MNRTLELMARRVGLTLLLLGVLTAVLAVVCWWSGLDDGSIVRSVHTVGGLILLVIALACGAVGMAAVSAIPPVDAGQEKPPARV